MKIGTVKFYNEKKGYGFIIETETKTEYFVHASGIVGRIHLNDDVTFEVTDSAKGPIAINVKMMTQ